MQRVSKVVIALALSTSPLIVGCPPQIRWQADPYDRVHGPTRQTGQLTFVYFRAWYLIECTQFEDTVLRDPAVVEAVSAMACCMLNFDWDRSLAEAWSLSRPPAYAITAPDGRVLVAGEGNISKEALLADIRKAKSVFGQNSGRR
ncbi:MAG: hypothetical protein JNG88_16515 [Phycisphaerales bacterium]|nr:hypothetical protein [Phycisphaerales bacterium]